MPPDDGTGMFVADPNPVFMGDDEGVMQMDFGQPQIGFVGLLVLLLLLKFFADSNLLTLNTSEVKVSLHNIISIGLQASAFIIGAKVVNGALVQRGVIIPGTPELISAL